MSVLLWMGMSLSGCALTRDVETLDQRTARLQSQMSQLQKENQALRNELSATKTDVGGETKRSQADLLLKIESLESQLRSLSAGMEEYKDFLKKPSKEIDRVKEDVATRTKLLEERSKALEGKDKALEDRVKLLEENLRAIDAKIDRLTSKQQETEKSASAREMTSETKTASLSRGAGDLYKDAYESFQKGNLDAARKKFETFIRQYPNTELSDNAQFWIGETYYLKKDYEKAILEYEKAISKYPEGDKVPAALFKQAIAFLDLGDKTNGRNLLKRVIERYPHSDQAEMAKKRLDTIK
jgi:tol-pal system protein YbgF